MEKNKTDDWKKVKTQQLSTEHSLFRKKKKQETRVQAKGGIRGERKGVKRLTIGARNLGEIDNFSEEPNLSEEDNAKEERAFILKKIPSLLENLSMYKRSSRLVQCSTPRARHIRDGAMTRHNMNRAHSVMSAVSSKSRVSIRSIMRTRSRCSVVTVTRSCNSS